MARGYWLPENSENLLACNGFFVDEKAVAESDADKRWSVFLEQVSNELRSRQRTLQAKNKWQTSSNGATRFVVLSNNHIDVVAGESRGYYAIYILIPEDCKMPYTAKDAFWRYMLDLKQTLISLYPGCVKQRKNYRQLIDIG